MIYLDYSATTPLNDEIRNTYEKLLEKYFANADSAYSLGYEVNRLIEKSRENIAKLLKVTPQELIFTSCASEANNTAIKGVCFEYMNRGKHIITTSIEHSSVDHTFKQLEEIFGFDVDYLSVDENGKINLEELKNILRDDTILVSTMAVNNEIGVINPIHEIAQIIHEKNPKTKYHVDFVQALGKIPVDLKDIDLATFSAHKIYGLKGSGLLYKKRNTTLIPLVNGGQQEYGLRGGTSNSAVEIVLAKTIRLALESQPAHFDYVTKLNHYLREQLIERNIVINSPSDASPYIVNISLLHYKPEVIVHELETYGIYLSTRSACASKKTDISHTLSAMPISKERAESAIRISLSHLTSKEDIDTFIEALDKTLLNIKKQR